MSNSISKFLLVALSVVQTSALLTLLGLAIAIGVSSILAIIGFWPWLELDLRFGDTQIAHAGMYLQLGVTGLALGLCAFLPSHNRIMALERSHRSFSLNMQDIAEAYWRSHQADRAGSFALSEEYDAVRERLSHLRDHPDLKHLEPEILEVAAQMSFQSRDLAQIYSDDKVKRAESFLHQRQKEADEMAERLHAARQTCDALKRWLADVEADERLAEAQITRLEADLMELLPSLGYELDADPNVVKLSAKLGADAPDDSRKRTRTRPPH